MRPGTSRPLKWYKLHPLKHLRGLRQLQGPSSPSESSPVASGLGEITGWDSQTKLSKGVTTVMFLISDSKLWILPSVKGKVRLDWERFELLDRATALSGTLSILALLQLLISISKFNFQLFQVRLDWERFELRLLDRATTLSGTAVYFATPLIFDSNLPIFAWQVWQLLGI